MYSPSRDAENFPLLWINLNRAKKRRNRMEWAIKEGKWEAKRLEAIDAKDQQQILFSMPNLLKGGTNIPGIYKNSEADPMRHTSRAESMSCVGKNANASKTTKTLSGWLLLMEDDVGASLATPKSWKYSLQELVEYCPKRNSSHSTSTTSKNTNGAL